MEGGREGERERGREGRREGERERGKEGRRERGREGGSMILRGMYLVQNPSVTCGCPANSCRHVSDVRDGWSWWLRERHWGRGHLSCLIGTVQTFGVINSYSHPVGSEE